MVQVRDDGDDEAVMDDTVKEVLLKQLKKLRAEEFQEFKFYLEEYGSKAEATLSKDTSVMAISPCDLENADRRRTVDLIVQTYPSQSVEVTHQVLHKVGRNDLVESFSENTRRGPLQLNAEHLQ
ncbi:apoptosis-associated speck-like protein containing a CARD [Lates japonicus]|uniref:Apoptosis-associated speck-like protein containing a CARD n=1 Tax=Lates japonicus TaxID=270547 RepID=A0AAD3NES0_LATJO|nr:apoptosis-associated speck-like protein containing a CARD [Lates japonicus]GLD71113.1 apoptosis-associated speck-like protein containing a CARD [Lates japonicus]